MSEMSLKYRVEAEVAQAQAAMRGLTTEFQRFGAGAKAAMREAATGNTGMANGFEMLRASVDPAFAAMKKYQSVQADLAGMVERGEATQAAANIVLEQARSRYMGVATAAEQHAAAERASAAATEANAAEVAALQARFTGLRASVDPAFAAMLRFSDAEKLAASAVRNGTATQAEAAATLALLRTRLDEAGAATGKFGAAQTVAAAHAGRNAAITGNVAAQFNDIGVMLAAGQNPFQLAIQQGTQLSQVFAMVGGGARGVLGALKAGFLALLSPTTLLTVGLIAGGAALVQWVFSAGEASEKSDELKKRAEELSRAIDDLKTAESAAVEPMDKLVEKYGALAGAVREARVQLADNAFAKAKSDFDALVSSTGVGMVLPSADTAGLHDLIAQYGVLKTTMEQARTAAEAKGTFYDATKDSEQLALLSNRIQNTAVYIGALRDEFKISQPQAEALAVALSKMADAGTAKDQVVAAQELKDMLVSVFGSIKAADEATGGMVTALSTAVERGAELAAVSGQIGGKLGSSVDAALGLATQLHNVGAWALEAKTHAEGLAAVDINSGIVVAANSAAVLARNMGVTLAAAQALLAGGYNNAPVVFDPRDPRYDAGAAARAGGFGFDHGSTSPFDPSRIADLGVGATGGGGGGGAKPDTVASLSSDAKEAMADLELAVAAINEKVKAGLMSTAEAADAVASAKEKAGGSVAELIAQIDKLGPAGHAAADDLRTKLQGLASDLKQPISDLAKSLSDGLLDPLKDAIKGTASLGDAFEAMGDRIIDKMIDMALQQAQNGFLEPLIAAIFGGGGGGGLGSLLGGGDLFANIGGFSEGGEVGGVGTGTSDSNLRRLSKGEYVVKASATAQHRGLLDAINSGRALPDLRPPSLGELVEPLTRQRASPSQDRAAGSAVAERISRAPQNIVNIQPPAGHEAVVSERASGIDTITDVIFQMVDGKLAAAARSGHGAHVAALADTFGLKRQPR